VNAFTEDSPYGTGGFVVNLRGAAAVALAGTIVAATGVISADTASAATPRDFCVNNTSVCAFPNGGSAVQMYEVSQDPNPLWLFNGVNHPGQIQQNGTSLCMQLDADAGHVVIEATCNGANYQKWNPYYIGGVVVYASEWDQTQCLTYNEDLSRLDTVACTGAWYQNFPGTT
jgi:hypothetical protein